MNQLEIWQKDPVQFVKDNFGATPDAWQEKALRAFPENQRMAFVASKGVGKTTLLAWCIWNFLSTRPNAKIACTSISFDNLSDGLRSELAHWQAKSPFLTNFFTLTKTRVFCKENSESWFCSFRAWSKSADQSQQALTLAGLHADYIMFVCDEVGSYPEAIIATAEAALASGIETKLVIVGNPTDVNGPLYRVTTKDKKYWYTQHINSDPDNPDRSPRVDIEWAKKQIDTYGRDSAWCKVNVLGEFPDAGLNTLFARKQVEESMGKTAPLDQYQSWQKRLGIDVARFGEDSTVIFPRQGKMCFNPIVMRGARTQEIVTRVVLSIDKWGAQAAFVDGTGGFGAGVCDQLFALGHTPYEIHFSQKANDERFANARTEMYWQLNEWVKQGGCLPQIQELKEELLAHTYSFNAKGQFILDPKESIKERLGRSPDLADALALSFSIPDIVSNPILDKTRGSRMKHDYDPFQ